MDRWTIKQLKGISSLDFAIAILRERRAKVTPYSPLGQKLDETIKTLSDIREADFKAEATTDDKE